MLKRIAVIVFLVTGCSTTNSEISRPFHIEPDIVVDRFDTSYWKPGYKGAAKYPNYALRKGIEGCVNVSYIIDSKGRVAFAEVLKSIPQNLFDKASLTAVRRFKLKPGLSNPDRLAVRTNTIMAFTVQGGNTSEFWYQKCEI